MRPFSASLSTVKLISVVSLSLLLLIQVKVIFKIILAEENPSMGVFASRTIYNRTILQPRAQYREDVVREICLSIILFCLAENVTLWRSLALRIGVGRQVKCYVCVRRDADPSGRSLIVFSILCSCQGG